MVWLPITALFSLIAVFVYIGFHRPLRTSPDWKGHTTVASNHGVSRIERIKEELGWLKTVVAIAAALDASIIAWAALNFESAGRLLLSAGLVGALVLTAVIVGILRQVKLLLTELEGL